ncbi:MAG: hypothetical protein ACI4SB_08640, partial [Acutalibacteraceae bacterium]
GQYTIRSNANYPQYLEYKNNTLVPVTQIDQSDLDNEGGTFTISSILTIFLSTFMSVFGTLIKILFGILGSQ